MEEIWKTCEGGGKKHTKRRWNFEGKMNETWTRNLLLKSWKLTPFSAGKKWKTKTIRFWPAVPSTTRFCWGSPEWARPVRHLLFIYIESSGKLPSYTNLQHQQTLFPRPYKKLEDNKTPLKSTQTLKTLFKKFKKQRSPKKTWIIQ